MFRLLIKIFRFHCLSLIENAVTEFFLFQIFLSTFLFPIVFLFSTYIILAKKLPALPQIYISASHSDTSPDPLHCKTCRMAWHMFYKADTMPDKSPASHHFLYAAQKPESGTSTPLFPDLHFLV